MAHRALLTKFFAEFDAILWVSEVAGALQMTELDVEERFAHLIYEPEADPGERCINRSELIDELSKE
jgi:hypothetical protein